MFSRRGGPKPRDNLPAPAVSAGDDAWEDSPDPNPGYQAAPKPYFRDNRDNNRDSRDNNRDDRDNNRDNRDNRYVPLPNLFFFINLFLSTNQDAGIFQISNGINPLYMYIFYNEP